MSENPPPDRLQRLGTEIDKARRDRLSRESKRRTAPPQGALAFGWRVATELVAALAVGAGLGWGFDRAFGTRHWGLIVFFLLGSAAGMLNVYRAAKGMIFGGPPPPGDGGESRRS
jgi:ATP synthase protein I